MFKFGQKVTHKEYGLGLVLITNNRTSMVFFESLRHQKGVYNSEITPVSEWIACGDGLPKIDVATRESNEVFFEDLDETIHHGWFRDGRSDEHSMYFIANLNAEIKSIDKVIRWMYVSS